VLFIIAIAETGRNRLVEGKKRTPRWGYPEYIEETPHILRGHHQVLMRRKLQG
jgi:hypothetical protein